MSKSGSFEWTIKNFSYCPLRKGLAIESPTFHVNTSPQTIWSLILYPNRVATEDDVCVYLRGGNDDSVSIINAGVNISFHDANGTLLVERVIARTVDKGAVLRMKAFAGQDRIFGAERKALPQDILVIKCSLKCLVSMLYHTLVTVENNVWTIFNLTTTSASFFLKFDGLNKVSAQKRNHFVIMNKKREDLMNFYLVLGSNGDIMQEIISWDENLESFSFKISVIDCKEEKVDFGFHKYFADKFRTTTEPLIRREQLMQNESRFLPNGVLSLVYEYALSTFDAEHLCAENKFGVISHSITQDHKQNENKSVDMQNGSQNESRQIQSLVEDLKTMYNDAVLSDVELRTSTKKTFPAHRSILSARSSVFEKMFSNDMKERNNGHVDITDVEDDTLHRMLLYVYTDLLEDLWFDSASKLYSAADKYAIFSLKEKCSRFLKANTSANTACDLLVLADQHQDDDLKVATQDYILCHDKEIFGSQKWKDFMATNLQLAADVMYRKVSPS